MAYLKDESGQTSTEYILLVAVVAMIIFKFKKTGGDALDKLTGQVFDKAGTMVDGIDASCCLFSFNIQSLNNEIQNNNKSFRASSY